jgi:acetyl esterase/lipase
MGEMAVAAVSHMNVVVSEPAEGVKLKLDVYANASAVEPHPAILLIHGGRWNSDLS